MKNPISVSLLSTLLATALSSAYASAATLNLTNIDTDNYDYCQQVASEVRLLNNVNAAVESNCIGPSQFMSNQGIVYSFRVVSTVTTLEPLYVGSSIQLANLDTDNPDPLLQDLGYFQQGSNPLILNLEGPGDFISSQGVVYSYRIQVLLNVEQAQLPVLNPQPIENQPPIWNQPIGNPPHFGNEPPIRGVNR